jgi:hypothetical protein
MKCAVTPPSATVNDAENAGHLKNYHVTVADARPSGT